MKNKWAWYALAVSVMLNLLLAGFLLGRASGPPVWAAKRIDPSIGLFRLDGLPGERRRELFAEFKVRSELRGPLRKMRGDQRAIYRTLTAETLNAEELAQALAGFRRNFDMFQEHSHQVFIKLISSLTGEERRKVVASLSRSRRPFTPHRPGPPHRNHHPPPDQLPAGH